MNSSTWGYVTAFALLVTLWQPVSCDSDGSAAQTSEHQKVFGQVVSEETLAIENLRSFDIANGFLCVTSGTEGGATSDFDVYDIMTMEKLWSIRRPTHYYQVNHGSRPSVGFANSYTEIGSVYSIYDLTGVHLFDTDTIQGRLIGSPSGDFFCQTNWDLGRSSVFDRHGQVLFTRDVRGPDFSAVPFDDSVVIHSTCDNVEFLSATSGEVLVSLLSPDDMYMSDIRQIVTSPNGGHALVSWRAHDHSYRTACIGADLRVGWEDNLDVITGGFSPDAALVAVLHGQFGLVGSTWLSLYRTSTGERLWSEEIPLDAHMWIDSSPAVHFTDGLVLLPTHWTSFAANRSIRGKVATYIAKISPSSGVLISTCIEEGIVVSSCLDGRLLTARLSMDGTAEQIIIREWQHDSKE